MQLAIEVRRGTRTAALVAAACIACSDGTEPKAPTVATVSVTAGVTTLEVGDSTNLTAVAAAADGTPMPNATITWSSSATDVIAVSSTGRATAVGAGSATITATSSGVSGMVQLTGTLTLETVTVTPATITVEAGDTTRLTVAGRNKNNVTVPGLSVTWSSSATGVATVSSSGLVTGTGAGTATITASSGGISATSTATGTLTLDAIAVSPSTASLEAGDTTRLTATPQNRNAVTVPGLTVTWSSSAAGVATISSTGLVTGVGAGSATITAASGGKSGTSTVTGALTVNAVSVSNSTLSMEAGDTTRLTASATNRNGIAVPSASFTWSSSASSVATVGGSGLVTGISNGSATVTATSNAKSGTSSVTVTLTTNTVTVTPAALSIEAGDTTRLAVSATNRNGVSVPTAGVVWSSSATGVATVSTAGLVTGVGAGSATITATLDSKSGTSSATGTLTLDAILVAPATVSLEAGDTTRLTATTQNRNAVPVTGVTVTWGSSATGVATVNSTGLLTGVSSGSATITASGGGKSGTSAVTGTLTTNTVTVTPASFSIEASDTTRLTATAVNRNNIAVPTTGLTWSTSAASVATVSTSGLVTGVGAGSATITATLDTKSGTSAATGTLTAASLTLGSANDTVRIAQTRQLTATVTSIRGVVMTGSSITWATLAAGVATVSASGLVTGVGVGNTSVIAASGTKADTTAVRVNSRNPVFASVRASRYSAEVGRPTELIWSVSDPDGESLTCSIDRDNDGAADTTFTNCAASTQARIVYSSGSGNKLVRITASDGQGGTASDTVTIALYAGNNLATGMNANLVLSAFGFNNSGGSGVYHHNAGMATDGTRFFLADRNNNRVLMWNALPTSNSTPDFVLGQPSFLTNDPGSGLDQMNWPVAIAVGAGKLFVADGYNDRILVWNTLPTSSGAPASFALTGSGDLVKWPWGVWTNGTKLAASNTIEGKVLIWNTIPSSNVAANVVLKDIATFGSGGSPTPRSITSNGSMFSVSDHNPPGQANQGLHVWNTFPTLNVAPSYFSSAPEDPQYAWMQGDFTGDGKLYLFGRYIWGYNTVPTAATGTGGINAPSFTIRSNNARLEGGDGSDLKFAGGRMYVSMANGNRVLVYNSIPTADAEPSFALGAPTVSTNTALTNYLITSPIPASDGRRLFATSGFERRLNIWRTIPTVSGTAPDAVFGFQSSGNTYDMQPADNTLFGNVFMAAGEKAIAIWTSLPLNGEAPTTMLRDNIGSVALTDIKGIAYDGVNTYVTDGSTKLYVWAGIPTASSVPVAALTVSAGVGRISSDGTTIMWSNGVTNRAHYCLVANLAGCAGAASTFGAALVPNLPSDVLVAGGRVFLVDGGFNRVQVWNNVASATGGAAPDVILGKPNTTDVTPRIGQSQLFWPGTIAYDGHNVWVGEFKFSGRLVAYPLP